MPGMTPDDLIARIFSLQEQMDPDSDPGDLSIDVQDDMPLVTVSQTGWRHKTNFSGVMGPSVQDALENYLVALQRGDLVPVSDE